MLTAGSVKVVDLTTREYNIFFNLAIRKLIVVYYSLDRN